MVNIGLIHLAEKRPKNRGFGYTGTETIQGTTDIAAYRSRRGLAMTFRRTSFSPRQFRWPLAAFGVSFACGFLKPAVESPRVHKFLPDRPPQSIIEIIHGHGTYVQDRGCRPFRCNRGETCRSRDYRGPQRGHAIRQRCAALP